MTQFDTEPQGEWPFIEQSVFADHLDRELNRAKNLSATGYEPVSHVITDIGEKHEITLGSFEVEPSRKVGHIVLNFKDKVSEHKKGVVIAGVLVGVTVAAVLKASRSIKVRQES